MDNIQSLIKNGIVYFYDETNKCWRFKDLKYKKIQNAITVDVPKGKHSFEIEFSETENFSSKITYSSIKNLHDGAILVFLKLKGIFEHLNEPIIDNSIYSKITIIPSINMMIINFGRFRWIDENGKSGNWIPFIVPGQNLGNCIREEMEESSIIAESVIPESSVVPESISSSIVPESSIIPDVPTEWKFIGKYIKLTSKYLSSHYWISDGIPRAYDIGTTGLGPFSVDVEIYANGKSDDCWFVFEGSDPSIYQNYPDIGQNENGYVWYTYKDKELNNSYFNEKIATIPSGKVFSIMVVDTQEAEAYWYGTITLEGLSSNIDLTSYKTSSYLNYLFKIVTIDTQNQSQTEEQYEQNELPDSIEMELGYEYELYIKHK